MFFYHDDSVRKNEERVKITITMDGHLYNVVKTISQSSGMTMGKVIEKAIEKIYNEYDEATKAMIDGSEEIRKKLIVPFEYPKKEKSKNEK